MNKKISPSILKVQGVYPNSVFVVKRYDNLWNTITVQITHLHIGIQLTWTHQKKTERILIYEQKME
jgi:hypothetical protein